MCVCVAWIKVFVSFRYVNESLLGKMNEIFIELCSHYSLHYCSTTFFLLLLPCLLSWRWLRVDPSEFISCVNDTASLSKINKNNSSESSMSSSENNYDTKPTTLRNFVFNYGMYFTGSTFLHKISDNNDEEGVTITSRVLVSSNAVTKFGSSVVLWYCYCICGRT